MLILFSLCIAYGEVKTVDSKNFPKALQQTAILATVRIRNAEEGSEGSGVLVARDGPFVFVLTAAHVVGKAREVDVLIFSEKTYPKPEQTYRAAAVLTREPRSDLALIRFAPHDPLPALLPIASGALADEKNFPALTVGCGTAGTPVATEERVLATRFVRKPGEEGNTLCWVIEKGQGQGKSGGPLVNRQGRLIGVASGASDGLGYCVHVEEIRAFLKRNGFHWLLENKKDGGKSISPHDPETLSSRGIHEYFTNTIDHLREEPGNVESRERTVRSRDRLR